MELLISSQFQRGSFPTNRIENQDFVVDMQGLGKMKLSDWQIDSQGCQEFNFWPIPNWFWVVRL